jgi:hypothetical protein
LTDKSLDFIEDKNLQSVLEDRLTELDRVFGVNANLSTMILSISSIEGIFRWLLEKFKKEVLVDATYPLDGKGKKKKISKLMLEEIYNLLVRKGILIQISNFDRFYELFRQYRNFIHPQSQSKQLWPVGLGQAQIALGLLNSTIDQLSKYIFIGKETLQKISGRPRYDKSRILHLDLSATRTNSFVILKRGIDTSLKIDYEVEMGDKAVLNFVFNYMDESNFNMLRLDNRDNPRTPNALLYSRQKDIWHILGEASQRQPPQGPVIVQIKIDIANQRFSFKVNGIDQAYAYADAQGPINLFGLFKKGLQIGWFNEVEPVKIMNLQIQ